MFAFNKRLTFESLDSTNRFARDGLGTAQLGHGQVIQALHQTSGRGRLGREWSSPLGNMYASFVVIPDTAFERWAEMSLVMAVAACRAVSSLLEGVGIKWPNDLWLSGHKLGGILLETVTGDGIGAEQRTYQPLGLVIGIGINVLSHPSVLPDDYEATHMRMHGYGGDADQVLSVLCQEFSCMYDLWRCSGFMAIHKEWMKRSVMLGQAVTLTHGDNVFSGEFVGIDSSGHALLKDEYGTIQTFASGRLRPIHNKVKI